ncbi:MAG TPA: DUF362 domain-containing protein [Terriglobales bacterium]|nr:DUF362 domain-containing protein [Terriglobales bacterium]
MNISFDSPLVALHYDPHAGGYSANPPFDPQVRYPEYDGPLSAHGSSNHAYDAVRETLFLLGLDAEHYGLSNWNPLGELISPGELVVIKPNLVMHRHLRGKDPNSVITHGSVVRAVVDYVCLALQGRGRIVIGDAPLQMADMGRISEISGLGEVAESATRRFGVAVNVTDFRRVRAVLKNGLLQAIATNPGDPNGYRVVDFGKSSLLAPVSQNHESYRVTCYANEALSRHHNEFKNEYLIAGSALSADCVVSISKLKTHRKAGITVALKNLVGINGHKDWLPHHRCGGKQDGGDEYMHASFGKRASSELALRALRSADHFSAALHRLSIAAGAAAKRISRDPFTEGSWYGNDTLWRTVLDLNRALIYADRNGNLQKSPQRKCLHLVDAIIAGQGEGPLEPDPKLCGVMLGGFSPVAIDTVAAGLMGFDYRNIPTISQAYLVQEMPLTTFWPQHIGIQSNRREFQDFNPVHPEPYFIFRPPAGWRGHIKRNEMHAKTSEAELCDARY